MAVDRLASDPLAKLKSAVYSLADSPENSLQLKLWLDEELDEFGVPPRMAVSTWSEGLTLLVQAIQVDRRWLLGREDKVRGFVQSTLRFARPDGSMCLSTLPVQREVLGRAALALTDDPGVARVVAWWFPRLIAEDFDLGSPFLPASGGDDNPLACLRSDWTKRGEWIAVDARPVGSSTLVELGISGQPWLGPDWRTAGVPFGTMKPKPIHWSTRSMADVFEWSIKVGPTVLTRTVVLLRGQKLALLAEQQDGPPAATSASWSIGLGDGLEARSSVEHSALRLDAKSPRGSALAIPLGLPRQPGHHLGSVDGRLSLSHLGGERRRWLPLVLSWDGMRNKRGIFWRPLTVAEKSKACAPEVAFAARLSFGREETLVVYRSLAKPELRSFLGHQTTARFVVGWFNREGNIDPIVTIPA